MLYIQLDVYHVLIKMFGVYVYIIILMLVYFFLPLMLIFGELPIVFNYPKIFNIPFWSAMTAAGFLGFSMGYVTGYQIKMTSPLTHNVSGTAKSYVQTLIAVVVYTETKTVLWWISNIFVLGGSGLFAHVRAVEMKRNHNSNNTSDNNSNTLPK